MSQTLSNEPDPYTFEHYPKKFSVNIGHQTHNVRQLLRAAAVRGRDPDIRNGRLLDMHRQPIPISKQDEIYRKAGFVKKHGLWLRRKTLAKLRKQAAREIRNRKGLPYHGGNPLYPLYEQYHPTSPPNSPARQYYNPWV